MHFVLLRQLWSKETLIEDERKTEDVYLMKEANLETIKQFRSKLLLYVESKIFKGIFPKRTMTYLQSNEYVDEYAQKVRVLVIPGCAEQCLSIWKEI